MRLGGLLPNFVSPKFRGQRRRRLVRNYLLVFVSLITGGMIASGVLDIYFRYYETQEQIFQLQSEATQGAIARIAQFMLEIEGQMKSAALGLRLIGQEAGYENDFELRRLLYVAPAITDLVVFNRAGVAQLNASRFHAALPNASMDPSEGGGFLQAKQGVTYFGRVYFLHGSDPYITMAVPVESYPGNVVGVLQGEVSLRFIWDVIRNLRVGKAGYTYIVTRSGDIIAHSSMTVVSQRKKADELLQVQAALRPDPDIPAPESMIAHSLTGEKVLSSYAYLPSLDWAVIVERPISEAYYGLYASLLRTLTLLLIGFGIALLAAVYMARRVVRPLHQLSVGADRIASGDWGFRFDIKTGDEIEVLAERFNGMVSELQRSYQTLEDKVAQRTKELSALFDVSAAATLSLEITPVLQEVVQKISEIFGFDATRVFLPDRQRQDLRLVAASGFDPGDAVPRVFPRGAGIVGCVADTGEPIIIENVPCDPRYQQLTYSHASTRTGYDFLAAFPIKSKQRCLGVITCLGQNPRHLSAEENRLIVAMTGQIGAAIENISLFDEVKTKTSELENANQDLREALECQMAIAEVLRVMANSPAGLQPLLDAITIRAVELANARAGVIRIYDGGVLRFLAHYRDGRSNLEELQSLSPPPDEDSATTRAIREKKSVQVRDIRSRDSGYHGPVEKTTARTVLAVPIIRKGEPQGAIVIYRDVVEPFTERQVELVRTFADQAVIAIENVQLFQNLALRSRELSAIYDVSAAANRSLDLSAVLREVIVKFTVTFGFDATRIYVVEPNREDISLKASFGSSVETDPAGAPSRGRGIVRRVLESGSPVVFENIQIDSDYDLLSVTKAGKKDGFSFEGFFPIQSKGKVLGAVIALNRRARTLTREEVRLIEAVLDPVGVAIDNLQLFEELKKKTQALESANQELVVTNEHKTRFLADVTHELRTPLTVIKGSIENMLDGLTGDFNERQARYLARLRLNVDRLTRLINDLLDISRIEAGVVELHPTFFNLLQLLREVSDSLKPIAEKKQIAVTLIAPDHELTVWGDRTRVSQVLINLLNNAFQYSPSFRPVIVSAKRDRFGRVQISISDQGPGIGPEHTEKIFEKFYRVDGCDGVHHLGAGLGLNIAQNLVKLHGGDIWVDSEIGKGSTFHFTLSTMVPHQKPEAQRA